MWSAVMPLVVLTWVSVSSTVVLCRRPNVPNWNVPSPLIVLSAVDVPVHASLELSGCPQPQVFPANGTWRGNQRAGTRIATPDPDDGTSVRLRTERDATGERRGI